MFSGPPGAARTDAQPILEWEQLTGDWVGMRPMLSDHGAEFFANYTLDAWGNVSGRVKPGSTQADTMSIGFAYGHLSNGARSSLRSQNINPTDSEMVVELTYQAPITRWLIVQPDLQYFINPGANSELTNALVIEARATVIF